MFASGPSQPVLAPPDSSPASNYRWPAAWLGGSLLVLAMAGILQSGGPEQLVVPGLEWPLPPLCSWKLLTGSRCPGCGLTRSFVALAEGNLRQAWNHNPAGLLLFGIVVAQVPYRLLQLLQIARHRTATHFRGGRAVLWLTMATVLVQWIVRGTLLRW